MFPLGAAFAVATLLSLAEGIAPPQTPPFLHPRRDGGVSLGCPAEPNILSIEDFGALSGKDGYVRVSRSGA